MRPQIPIHDAKNNVKRSLCQSIENPLKEKYEEGLAGDFIKIKARTGSDCAWLLCEVGKQSSMHVFELFVSEVEGRLLEGALGVLVDFLDGTLEEFFEAKRDAYLTLDMTLYKFDEHDVYAKSALKRPALEQDADALLRAAGFDPNDVG